MAVAKQSSSQASAASVRDFKHRVLLCLTKLSDRDTHSAAATELESIAKTLAHDSISPFLSSISATDSSDKSPVRKQCVRLISLLSETHGDALSPYLSKLLSAIVRRLRDPDSAVRSACITATGSISSHITKPPFTSIVKPLVDALVTEQEHNSQIGAALCLASAIDASPDPEPLYLRRLLPKLEKLLKSDSFKAKPALLTLIGSVIGSRAISSEQVVKNLVHCLVEYVASEDWAARKTAAESLTKLVVMQRDMLSELKAPCLKTFEAKRFDKVKIVRETMNLLVETWKEIPDVVDDASPHPESQSSSRDVASDGRYPSGSKTSRAISARTQVRNKDIETKDLPSAAQGNSPRTIKKTGQAMFRKLDRKKPGNSNTPAILNPGNNVKDRDEKSTHIEPKQVLMKEKISVSKAVSRVVRCPDEMSGSTAVASNNPDDLYRQERESNELSSIRTQLVQIQNQQSSLLDLLQGFIGSSQNGMRSLESRVHGLELTLDEISYDVAVSTGRKSTSRHSCCIPGADFFMSKISRRPEVGPTRHLASNNGNADTIVPMTRRLRSQAVSGFIVNPLAEVHTDSRGISGFSANRMSANV
jgi:HEAT repeat protein